MWSLPSGMRLSLLVLFFQCVGRERRDDVSVSSDNNCSGTITQLGARRVPVSAARLNLVSLVAYEFRDVYTVGAKKGLISPPPLFFYKTRVGLSAVITPKWQNEARGFSA